MTNLILLFILILIVGSSCLYIRSHRKQGLKCIGCPYANSCSHGCLHRDHPKGIRP